MNTRDTLFSLRGRIGRSTYWLYSLPIAAILGGGWLIDDMLHGEEGMFYGIGGIVCLWPTLALSVKRCHDRNRTGWFFLVALIPVVSLWYLVEVGFLPGTPGANRYGPPVGVVEPDPSP